MAAPLADQLTPSQAVNLIAGVTSSDILNPRTYLFADGTHTGPAIDKAWQQLFDWLNDELLVGAIELPDGKWRRLSVEWVRSFRRMQKTWRRSEHDEQDCNKPPKMEVHNGKARPMALVEGVEVVVERLLERVVDAGNPQIEGLPWFVDKQPLLDCMDGLTGLTGDDRLAVLMRVGVAREKYPNIYQASMSVAGAAPGGGTLESRAQRLRRLEVRTRPNSQTSPGTSPKKL